MEIEMEIERRKGGFRSSVLGWSCGGFFVVDLEREGLYGWMGY